ncbi:TPA: DUF4406 domain-containing protein [Escherichia coli]|uniref:DUF4406 domain-containing protein n=1 Tax=Escherichia coli TaxID=562 RepID=UPI001603A704|nr:DUF4406 domain-containing protein [Escherichia coli]EHY5946590.1 DUF4406 domain-containing protein [Escherichia coli]EIH7502474.1 DUF4406 domain-containing protein [Escherichia coli]EIZ4596113.1 DUF4406 domain-containing protein [Escherichia coli]EJB3819827.1 DUF4406 domain-containing protein [Escherichia coli]EJE0566431.1 DUF4406 domain-containing protein [Escherichia coli]
MVKRVLKIYIAGPMTGYPDYNRAAFNAKASELMAEGHIVLNPAVLPGGLCQSEYMDICLAMVRSADAIYLLNRWEDSVGARAEHALAEKLGLTVIYESPTNIECQVAPHIYRELVNALRDIAAVYHSTEQLRERLAHTISYYLSLSHEHKLRQKVMIKFIMRLSKSLANADPKNPLPKEAMNYLKSCNVVSEDGVLLVRRSSA